MSRLRHIVKLLRTFATCAGPWWKSFRTVSLRPHLSTLVLLVPVLTVLVLANVPGWRMVYLDPLYRGRFELVVDASYEHGWPVTYLRRKCSADPAVPENWLPATYSSWDLPHDVIAFRGLCLAGDVVAGIGVLLVAGVLIEARRRGRHSCFQFHLSELMAFATFVAIGLSLYGVRRNVYIEERKIYTQLHPSWTPEVHFLVGPEDWRLEGPDWLLPILGEDRYRELFARLVSIDAGGDDLKEIAKLRRLLLVRLLPSSKEDTALLARIPTLEAIELGDAVGPNPSTIELPSLPRLRALYPCKPASLNPDLLTDSRIRGLAGLKSLESLYVMDGEFDDKSMVDLDGLIHLHWLFLNGTKITGAGLRSLQKATDLEYLLVGKTPIDDDALPIIAQRKRLSVLDLSNTHITDAGIESLKSLKDLRELDLNRTSVSAEGMHSLQQALPNCTIDWSPAAEGR